MKVPVEISDTIALTNSGIDGATATQVGSPPVWEDDSDATYVEVDGAYFGAGNPVFISTAEAALPAQALSGLSPSNPNFKLNLRLRLNGVQAGLPFPELWFRRIDAASVIIPASTPACPDAPDWVTLEIVNSTGDIGDLWADPSDWRFHIEAPTFTLSGSPSIRSWRIYEVELYFEVPTRESASCRNFPADTSNAPGGGVRQFPPSKAVVRSNRFGGGYL